MDAQSAMVNSGAASEHERRVSERIRCVIEAAVTDEEMGYRSATLLDISRGGVRLDLDQPPQVGELLQLTFLADGELLFRIAATVIYTDGWTAGCQFGHPLAESELSRLL